MTNSILNSNHVPPTFTHTLRRRRQLASACAWTADSGLVENRRSYGAYFILSITFVRLALMWLRIEFVAGENRVITECAHSFYWSVKKKSAHQHDRCTSKHSKRIHMCIIRLISHFQKLISIHLTIAAQKATSKIELKPNFRHCVTGIHFPWTPQSRAFAKILFSAQYKLHYHYLICFTLNSLFSKQ